MAQLRRPFERPWIGQAIASNGALLTYAGRELPAVVIPCVIGH